MARRNPAIPKPWQPSEPDRARGRPPTRRDPFQKPARPRGVWQMLAWVIFEYPLLERYAEILTWRQWVPLFCRAYLVITLLAGILYFGGIGLTVGFELPVRFPEAYTPAIRDAFMSQPDGITQAWLLIRKYGWYVAWGLPWGLAVGLAWGARRRSRSGPHRGPPQGPSQGSLQWASQWASQGASQWASQLALHWALHWASHAASQGASH
jgi:hypothetical protein